MRWQKLARLGVALFVVAFAGVVYVSLRQRQAATPAPRVEREDPTATLEITSGVLTQVTGVEADYEVSAETSLSYADGASKRKRVRIKAPKRDGRDFTITTAEATAGPDEKVLELNGAVRLDASDGFWLETDTATFDRTDGIARAPGAVTFGRGRMSGSGVGMTYDERNDVLTITAQADVTMAGEDEAAGMSFKAGASTLNRTANTLQMEGGVHVVRGEEQFDADRALARLSEREEFVTFIELRGNARVAGGAALDSMSARDIDLDYTDDGEVLERIALTGDAGVALAAAGGATGREIFAGVLDLALATDGAITKAVGRDGVRATFPAGAGAPARVITARALDGNGAPERGLTAVRFTEAVDYREGSSATASREAQSQSLTVALDGDTVSSASFAGRVTFRDQGLEARAATAGYAPAQGTIHLSGTDAGGGPMVSDEQIRIEGSAIDVTFDSRHMTAKGGVRTTLRPSAGPGNRRGAGQPASKLPGLLKADQAVTINAGSLDYRGTGGQVIYTGEATADAVLRQGPDTFIRATRIDLDQEAGNLTATGAARSSFTDDAGTTEGTADAIRYTDARRLLAYVATGVARARVKGPQGDLQARTIDITLEPGGARAASLVAQTLVSIALGQRTITGARLHYDATSEVYVMQGGPGRPMTIVNRAIDVCQQSTGMKVTFSKSTDDVTIEGEERVRPSMGSGGACTAVPPAPRPSSPAR